MGIYQLVVVQNAGGEECVNVFGINDAGIGPDDLQGFTDIFAESWRTHIAPLCSSAWQIVEFRFYNQADPVGSPPDIFTPTAGQVIGLSGGNMLPATVAGLVSYTTNSGPPYRGRAYLTGFDEGSNDGNGGIAATTVLSMANWASQIKNDFEALAGPVRWGVLRARTTANPTPVFASVNTIKVTDKWATQRRRDGR